MNRRKIISLLLSFCMIISLLPSAALATGPGEEAAASYPVYVHGGTLQKDGTTVRSGAKFPAGTVLTVTLDESLFSGHTFAYWLGSDGTQVPQRSFRMVVDRITGFSPAFSDLTGNFGDWKVLEKGELCTDGTLFVREDSAHRLKEYRFESGNHNTFTYEPLNDEQHTARCADCPYTDVYTHWWNSGEVTTEATCAAEGVKTYTCNQCGATKTEAIEKKTSHTYPYYPKDSDYEIITHAVGSAPGKRALKCSVCGQPGTERDYIVATLPNRSGVQHYKLTLESGYYSSSSSLNRGRIEEHYFTDDAYYYAVKRNVSSRGFMLLWFDEGANSPVYIKSVTKNSDGGFSATQAYGTPESNYYGILCYVDSREEFVELISHWSGIYTYDNGRSTSYLYNTVDGYRTFAKLWNENSSQFTPKFENYTLETWADPVKVYTRTYGGKQCEYYVNKDNACVRQWDGTERVWFTYDTRETFPFSKPERDKITWFSYYVMDGSYGYVYDDYYFGMASKDWSNEDRKVTPRDAATGKAFSHWEKYDPRTWQWEYCSDQAIWTPSVTDVTTLRAIYKDVTYHIKVNGGYYQISTGGDKWSDEKYTEGDVKYGTEIRINYDSSDIPAGQEYACITDVAGERLSSFTQKIQADNEYTIQYQTQTEYFEANADNGVVKKGDEVFSGGRFPIGSTVTLTTVGNEGYPYFKGWCRISYGSGKGDGTYYTVLSTDTTYTAEITRDSRQITAVWRATDDPLPEPQEPNWHNVTIANGFVRSENRGVAVSALRAQDNSYILVIRDPTLKRDVERWELTDADGNGTVLEQQPYDSYGNYFEISGTSGGGKYDGKYDGKGGKDPVPGDSPANILITGVLKQYCIHTCTTCGGCTDSADTCGVTKCTCTTEAKPLLTIPTTSYLNSTLPTGITVVAVEVDGITANQSNPYVSYALQAAEGYEVDKIYDISLQGADGQKYTLNDNETATITLTIGTENARLIDAGTLVLIHITDAGRVIYGKEAKAEQRALDAVDTAQGTVTFTTDSCSPFVLAHKAGVSVKGKVASYNGSHDLTVTLYQADSETVVGTLTVSGNEASRSTEQEFTIPNVPAGTYDLVVTKKAHLKYTVKNVVVETTDIDLTAHTDPAIRTITLLVGDVNGDGQINVTDLNIVWDAANFNKNVSAVTNKLTDINGDDNVNVTDLNIVWDAANFNKGAGNCTAQFKEE